MDKIVCDICYENNLKGIPCKVCRKEMCIDCEYNLIDKKCPFCRVETLNWYKKFIDATPSHKEFFISKYKKNIEKETNIYKNKIIFLELVIKTKNLNILKILKNEYVDNIRGILDCIIDIIYNYISTNRHNNEINICLRMINYIKNQNYKKEIWCHCYYKDIVLHYISNYSMKSIYKNIDKNSHIFKKFSEIQKMIRNISGIYIYYVPDGTICKQKYTSLSNTIRGKNRERSSVRNIFQP